MDDGDLELLMRDLESDRVERKASFADKDKVAEAICAFANDLPNHAKPGVLFVGLKDDGTCAGLDINDDLLLKLSDLRANGNIHPFPAMTVQKRMIGGCTVAVIVVEPSDSPPVRFRGRTMVRVGPRRAIATAEEERRLTERRRYANLPFDLRPVPFASLDDLDLFRFEREYVIAAVAPEVVAQNGRSVEQKLAALRFTTPDGQPTVAGVLVVGKDPRQFLPSAYVQFLRIEGTELGGDIKDAKEIGGDLTEILRQLDEVLRINISATVDIVGGSTEVRRADYPLAALQQLVRNAVLHRNYEGTNAPVRIYWFDDRVEILNPGGPFGQVTKLNFGRPGVTDYRNPHLAEAMKVLGFVQKFGFGIQAARKVLADNDNPPLDFAIEDAYVLATVRRRV